MNRRHVINMLICFLLRPSNSENWLDIRLIFLKFHFIDQHNVKTVLLNEVGDPLFAYFWWGRDQRPYF